MKKIVFCLISTILLLTACGAAGSTASTEGEANTSFYTKNQAGFETSAQVDTADYYAEESSEDASYHCSFFVDDGEALLLIIHDSISLSCYLDMS